MQSNKTPSDVVLQISEDQRFTASCSHVLLIEEYLIVCLYTSPSEQQCAKVINCWKSVFFSPKFEAMSINQNGGRQRPKTCKSHKNVNESTSDGLVLDDKIEWIGDGRLNGGGAAVGAVVADAAATADLVQSWRPRWLSVSRMQFRHWLQDRIASRQHPQTLTHACDRWRWRVAMSVLCEITIHLPRLSDATTATTISLDHLLPRDHILVLPPCWSRGVGILQNSTWWFAHRFVIDYLMPLPVPPLLLRSLKIVRRLKTASRRRLGFSGILRNTKQQNGNKRNGLWKERVKLRVFCENFAKYRHPEI